VDVGEPGTGKRKEKGERRKEKGERRKEKGERRKEKGEKLVAVLVFVSY